MDVPTLQVSTQEWLKLLIRHALFALLFYSGLSRLYRFLARKNKAVILMYHRVIEPADLSGHYIQAGMYVTKETFEMQMAYLSRNYHVIGLEELIEIVVSGSRLRENTCVITFDDGWRDNYGYAFPILKKYRLPATIFLVSDYVDTKRWFWPEKVSVLLMKYLGSKEFKEPRPAGSPALERMELFRLLSDSNLAPAQKIETVIEQMKDLNEDNRQKAIDELETLVKDRRETCTFDPLLLSWAEIIEMSRSGITFGSHTKSHTILTNVSRKEAEEQIVESKEKIENRLLKPCRAFCYPNGNRNEEIKRIVGKHYSCAISTQHGFVTPGDDLFDLKRIGIHNDITFTEPLFACRISGIVSFLGL
jgi:peptidoglycan/xylan/chitin deacetylase (PgdA/CDA1 family)